MNKLIIYFAVLSSLLVSCNTEILEDDEVGVDTHLLKVKTVSQGDDVIYPLQVYAYDANKNEVGRVEIASESDELSMELSTGTYTIAAVSGNTDSSKGYSTEPLMMAKGNVTITTKDETANLSLQYAVARLSVALSDIPKDMMNVTVTVKSLYTNATPLNELSESKPVELVCKYDEDDGLWKTDTVYVLPSDGNVTFTIETKYDKDNYKKYTYEYKAGLSAGTPYYFKGSYNSGIVSARVAFTLEGAEWREAVNNDFAFGEGVNENDDNIPVSSDASVFYVNEMPTACSVWNGHFLVLLDKETSEGLLYSNQEWSGVSSADEGASNVLEAVSIASSYKEDDLENWNIPTKEQAEAIVALAGSSSALCELLGYKNTFPTNRYLCNNALDYYNLNTKKMDSTYYSDYYYLRLVKPVRFIVNQ